MTFSKKTWATGDTITADLLNAIEQALLDHDTNIGDMSSLLTTNKTIAAALNELHNSVGSGSGNGIPAYNTLTDLQAALPTGSTQPVWVIADQEFYYWSGTATDTTAPTVTISPAAGTFNANQSVTLTGSDNSGVAPTIYYTTDGSTPTTSSTVYSAPIAVSATTTINYFAKDGSGNSSTVQSATYTIDTTAPVITVSPQGSTYSSTQTVTVSLNEPGTIYYTLDGSTPTTSSTVYSSPLTISSTSTLSILAKDTAGNTSTRQDIYTISVAAPSDVTNLATSNVSNSSVTLTWTAASTATSYDVYNGATLLGNTTNTNYQATSLSSSTSYTFKVVAKNAGGSSAGVTTTVTTLATAPNPVTSLAVTTASITPSSIPVTWTAPSGGSAVDHYEVAYSTDGTNYTVSSNAVNSSSTSYTVTGLHQTTNYTIRVVAIDASANRSQAATVSGTTATLTVSASPAAGTYSSSQTVTLSSNGVAGTNIYYTTDGTTPTTSSTLYSSSITVSATETIKFFAQNPVGDQSSVQSATYTISTSTPPNDVTNFVAGTIANTRIPVSWTAPSGGTAVSTYELAYSTGGTFTVASSSVASTATSYIFTGLTANTTYTLRIVAVDASGNRSAGVTINATTTNAAMISDSSLLYSGSNIAPGTSVANPANYFTGSQPFSVCVTVKLAKYQTVFSKYTAGATDNDINLNRDGGDHFTATLYGTSGGTSSTPQAQSATYSDETVNYNLMLVWDNTNLTLYVNNAVAKQLGLTSSFAFNTSSQSFIIGKSGESSTFKNFAYYNRALTSSELTQNYQALA